MCLGSAGRSFTGGKATDRKATSAMPQYDKVYETSLIPTKQIATGHRDDVPYKKQIKNKIKR
jgi:hypothetical protein